MRQHVDLIVRLLWIDSFTPPIAQFAGMWNNREMEDPEFITVTEAAHLLGVSWRSVKKYIADGRLKGKLLGPSWIVSKASMQSFERPQRIKLHKKQEP
jgi:excisionase family DNA binding protein